MRPTLVQHQAIEARISMIVGADEFDRLFLGFEVGEIDGDILFVSARSEHCAAEIEGKYALHISIVATQVLNREINFVTVLPKELSSI